MSDHNLARLRYFAYGGPRAEVPAVSVEGTTATLRIYDPIDSYGGSWGVSAREFAEMVDGLDASVSEIRVHLNSPGGEVFDAIAITNTLRAHKARVVAIVDGIAASAASVIACAADELIMSPHSQLMIHDAWGVCVGNAGDMAEMAKTLNKISATIADVYASKAGDGVDWRAAMAAESWFSAEEAVSAGLADSIADSGSKVENRFDLSMFNFAGRDNAPPPVLAEPEASDPISNTGESERVSEPEFKAPITHLFA